MSRLILRYPDSVVREVEFSKSNYKIGTASDNDLILESDEVEVHQAEIDTVEGAFSIVDVSEGKTTTVNGKQIERVNLNYGDRISFGPIIGLFYPPKESTVGPKTKLFLYLLAGGLVIVCSIVFFFFITSRRLSSVVSTQIEPLVTEERAVRGEPEEQIREEKKGFPAEAEEIESIEKERTERGFLFIKKRGAVPHILPEPDLETIQTRSSIAIPQGVRKLFFKKIHVIVEESIPAEEEIAPEEELYESPRTESPEEGVFPETTLETGELSEFIPEEEEFEEFMEELVEEESFLSKAFSPIKKLFGSREEAPRFIEEEFKEEGVEAVAGVSAIEAPGIRGEEEKPLPEDIRRIAHPLAILRSTDVQAVLKSDFGEKPIYSETELQEFKTRDILGSVSLSQSETLGASLIWSYPQETEEKDIIIRTGAIGKIDEDKAYDFLFGTKNGNFIALKGATGTPIVSQSFEKPFYSPIATDVDGNSTDDIILVFEDGDIGAYTRALEQIWLYKGKDRITSLPLLIDINRDRINDVVFTTLGMDIVALDGSSGFELWRFFDAESETVHSPVGIKLNKDSVHDVLFITNNGFLYAIDGKTGWGLWKKSCFGKPAGGCAVADLDGDNQLDIVCLTRKGILSSYTAQGELLFSSELGEDYITSPSIGDVDGDKNKEIVLINHEGTIRVFEGKTRREKWKFETEEGTTLGRIALVDMNTDGGLDVVYTSMSGLLLVINGKTGTQMAQYNYGDYILSTPIVYDLNRDRILEITAGTYGGDIFSVKIAGVSSRFFSFRKSYWSSVNHDVRNTGCSPFTYDLTFWN